MKLILLSGGLDSALNLALAAEAKQAALALSFAYAQSAESAELQAASALAKYYGVEWRSVDLRWLGAVNPTGLTRPDQSLPHLSSQELDDEKLSDASMRAVWVANRNGVFLNVAAAFAEALGLDTVVPGFNKEEAATFPDNSLDYMKALERAFAYSTLNGIRVESYTHAMDKTEIIAKALAISLPLDLVWSCYEKGPKRCWVCESCKRSERALLKHGSQGLEWLAKMGWQKANHV